MIGRLWHTARHLRWEQFYQRIARRLPKRLISDYREATLSLPMGRWMAGLAPEPLMTGPTKVRIHGLERDIASPSAWTLSDVPALWRYHLHYFDDLVAVGAESRHEWHLTLLRRWLAENPIGTAPAWDPYPISLRVVNWLKWALAGHTLCDEAAASLRLQLAYLERRIERHLLGNHVLENGKALWFGGCCFSGQSAQRWGQVGRDVFLGQLEEQVLADGGHFERSAMYHARVLENVLDLINLETACGNVVPIELRSVAVRMLRWLTAMSHPDGEYALFNDCAFGQAQNVAALSDYAQRLGLPVPQSVTGTELLPDTGYARVARGPWIVFLDLAPIAVDYQPAHGHADALTFELSMNGARIIVDSGTSTYEAGPDRTRQRSTAGHNTVTIAGRDSSEMWAAFRVARRARILSRSFSEADSAVVATAAHDGFRQQGIPIVHAREWIIADDVVRIVDRISGHGIWPVASRFHLHPSVTAVEVKRATFHLLRGHEVVAVVVADPLLEWSIEQTSYHPRFGEAIPNTVIVGRRTIPAPSDWRVEIWRFGA